MAALVQVWKEKRIQGIETAEENILFEIKGRHQHMW